MLDTDNSVYESFNLESKIESVNSVEWADSKVWTQAKIITDELNSFVRKSLNKLLLTT